MSQNLSSGMPRQPWTVRITFVSFLVIAALWLLFSLFVVLGGNVSYFHIGAFRWIMAGLTFLASILLAALGYLLRRRFKPAWYFSVLLLAAMILAGFMDELGLIDYAFIVLVMIPLALLIKDRKWFLKKIG